MKKIFFLFLFVDVITSVLGFFLTYTIEDVDLSRAIGFFTLLFVIFCVTIQVHFYHEDAFFEKFEILNMLKNTQVDSDILSLVKSFNSIDNSYLNVLKEDRYLEFKKIINDIAVRKKIVLNSSAEHIRLIGIALQNAKSGDYCRAISFCKPGEFQETQSEENFRTAQLEAIKKGLVIDRIFVCKEDFLCDFKETKYWDDHTSCINGYFVNIDHVSASLLRTTGFILFKDIVIHDRLIGDELTGELSCSEDDIQQANVLYQALLSSSTPLKKCEIIK